jgi:predicted nucleic acid-binding protein
MATVVVDHSAMLALLRGEDGSDFVRSILERAAERGSPVHMSELDFAELRETVRQREGAKAWEEIVPNLSASLITFHSIDRSIACNAAEMRTKWKWSLLESVTAALAKKLKAELVTRNKSFEHGSSDIRVRIF